MALPRGFKRFIIAAIFFTLIFLPLLGVYFAFLRPAPTCFDNKQNQNEEGVDCGGVCSAVCKEEIVGEKFQIKELAFVPGGEGKYDAFGKIYNPNDQAGSPSFKYVFELKDAQGTVLVSCSGESYILPQETKTLVELNLESIEQPLTASLRISDVTWEKFSGYKEKPSVNVYQKNYTALGPGPIFGTVSGLTVNESPYDFRSVYIKIILRDGSGKPLALNMTRQDALKAGEQRDFTLPFPNAFSGTVEQVETEVDADVFHSDNFLQQYFPGGRFQEFKAPSKNGV